MRRGGKSERERGEGEVAGEANRSLLSSVASLHYSNSTGEPGSSAQAPSKEHPSVSPRNPRLPRFAASVGISSIFVPLIRARRSVFGVLIFSAATSRFLGYLPPAVSHRQLLRSRYFTERVRSLPLFLSLYFASPCVPRSRRLPVTGRVLGPPQIRLMRFRVTRNTKSVCLSYLVRLVLMTQRPMFRETRKSLQVSHELFSLIPEQIGVTSAMFVLRSGFLRIDISPLFLRLLSQLQYASVFRRQLIYAAVVVNV